MSQSNKLIAVLVVFAIIIAIPAIVLSRRPKQSPDKVTRLAVMAMTSDLRGLIMAEQATRDIRGRDVASGEDAGHISSPGVTPPVIVLSDTGWSATVQYKTI